VEESARKDEITLTAMIVDAAGVRLAAHAADVCERAAAGRFFWLDMFGGDEAARSGHLAQLRLESADIAWARRFGQAGRMMVGRQKLRAVTWMADPRGNLIEVHVLSSQQCILTVWSGDPAALDEIREQFSERLGGLEKSPYHAAAILLQLLLGTLDQAIRNLDLGLDDLRMRLDSDTSQANFALLARRLQKLQSVVASFDRYGSAVRSAIVGVEAVPGMDAGGADELNDYVEQVEDVEEQLYERRRWMSDMMHDYATAIAQRQGEQINRLTLVSLIFLPVTALTGFFGMNFGWMIKALASADAFITLGVLLPVLSVIMSIAWFMHRGLIQLKLRPRWPLAMTKTPAAADPSGAPAWGQSNAATLAPFPDLGASEAVAGKSSS
jgi:Mg2+ and Co2+ transporter CorA